MAAPLAVVPPSQNVVGIGLNVRAALRLTPQAVGERAGNSRRCGGGRRGGDRRLRRRRRRRGARGRWGWRQRERHMIHAKSGAFGRIVVLVASAGWFFALGCACDNNGTTNPGEDGGLTDGSNGSSRGSSGSGSGGGLSGSLPRPFVDRKRVGRPFERNGDQRLLPSSGPLFKPARNE